MEFVNPGFLYALIALAIPVLIHLFNFRRFKKVYFTNVDFIKELKQQTQKQSRLKHLLVLLSRLLAIIALVFAFAQPYIPLSENPTIQSQRNFVQVYLDNSFSMQTGTDGGSLFQEAKNKAAELVEGYSESDRFNLVTNDFDGKHHRFVSKDEYLVLLNEVSFSPAVKNLDEVLNRMQSLDNNEPETGRMLFVISDFQKMFLDNELATGDTINQLFLVPVQAIQPGNLAIDSCWLDMPLIQLGQLVKLKVRISNYSESDYQKIPVRLSVNDKSRSVVTFDVPAFGKKVVDIPFTLNTAGSQYGVLSIEDHPVNFDDQFYFNFNVSGIVKVFSINGNENNPYLQRIYGLDTTFIFQTQNEKEVDYTSFFDHDLIILNELTDISSGFREQIGEFLKNGGTVALFPAANGISGPVNDFIASYLQGSSYLNIDSTRLSLHAPDPLQPLFTNVFDEFSEKLNLPEVQKHYPLQISNQSLINVILEMQNGEIFLAEVKVGEGSLFIFTSPLNSGFSDFQNHSLFVPVMYNMALSGQRISKLYQTLGKDEVLKIEPIGVNRDEVLKIISTEGDFEMIPGQLFTSDGVTLSTHGQIQQAGHFDVIKGDSVIAGLSFNYDRRESELKTINTDQIKAKIEKGMLGSAQLLSPADKPIAAEVKDLSMGIQLWKWFLLAALLFFLVEIILLRLSK